MAKDMFINVLQKDEEIVWCDGVNKKAYMIKSIIQGVLMSLFFGFFFGTFLSGPIGMVDRIKTPTDLFSNILLIGGIIFAIGVISTVINASLNAKNTFLAITNKRIIKRSGAFNNRFTHYSLKNVGNVEVIGGIFDTKGEEASAKLLVTTKDYHTNTDGNKSPKYLVINSLNNAYKAYNILSEKTEGNNEVFRVKNVD